MADFYRAMKINKQALHQRRQRRAMRTPIDYTVLVNQIMKIRRDHPHMNCRDVYRKIKPNGIGRDRFERFCKEWGFYLEKHRNFHRTTDSTGVVRFNNFLMDRTLTGIDQAWVSDITYFHMNGRFYYLTFVMDAYSRRILGHSASTRLTCESTTLPALKMAIKARGSVPNGIIFHSDGGGQYYAKEFLALTKKYKFQNSMCEYAWENGKAERINGTIKNNYLKYKSMTTMNGLIRELDKAIYLYNNDKPHISLKSLTPVHFESTTKITISLNTQSKPKMTESLEALAQSDGASSPYRLKQSKPQNQDVLNA